MPWRARRGSGFRRLLQQLEAGQVVGEGRRYRRSELPMDDGVRVEGEARHACGSQSSSGRNASSSATRTRGVVVMRPRQSGHPAGRSRATSAPFLTMTIGSPRPARSTNSNRWRRSRVIVTVTARDHHWECTRTSTLKRPAHPSVASRSGGHRVQESYEACRLRGAGAAEPMPSSRNDPRAGLAAPSRPPASLDGRDRSRRRCPSQKRSAA